MGRELFDDDGADAYGRLVDCRSSKTLKMRALSDVQCIGAPGRWSILAIGMKLVGHGKFVECVHELEFIGDDVLRPSLKKMKVRVDAVSGWCGFGRRVQ